MSVQIQSLNQTESKVLKFIHYYSKRFDNHVTVSVLNIANWIGRKARATLYILRSLADKGLIKRAKQGGGHHSLTELTEEGEKAVNLLNSIKEQRRKSFDKNPGILQGEKKIAHQIAHQNGSTPNNINIKTNNPPIPPTAEPPPDTPTRVLPKSLAGKFHFAASKVLSKITCTLASRVVQEFDDYSNTSVIRNPMAFLNHKVSEAQSMGSTDMKANQRLTTQDYINRSKWKQRIEEKALQMARDELYRLGKGYPTPDPSKTPLEQFEAVEEYGRQETAYYMKYKGELTAQFAKHL